MLAETDSETRARMLAGRCYCGAVGFRVEDAFVYASNCHCSNCRRTTGSAFKPFAGIERRKLDVVEGRNSLLVVGDDDLNDTHCAACGSLLFSVVREGEYVHVALGSLVDTPSIRPTKHIFVGSKAPWFEISDDLAQFEEHAEPIDPAEQTARSLRQVSAISLFVEDLQAAKEFYRDVFAVGVVFEDETSVCVTSWHQLFIDRWVASLQNSSSPPASLPHSPASVRTMSASVAARGTSSDSRVAISVVPASATSSAASRAISASSM